MVMFLILVLTVKEINFFQLSPSAIALIYLLFFHIIAFVIPAINPNIKPILYVLCKVINNVTNKGNSLMHFFARANFTETVNSIKTTPINKYKKIIGAVLKKKESITRESAVTTRANDKRLNSVKNFELLAVFFPLSNPYLLK